MLPNFYGLVLRGLPERINKSATFPTFIDPFVFYSRACQAPFIVTACKASLTEILCSGPKTLPAMVFLLTADSMISQKVFLPAASPISTTGESLWRVKVRFRLTAEPAGFILFALSGPRNIL